MHATGPITEAGKAASSRNAVKHGLLSEAPVVTCLESREEWEAHRAGVLADLAPNGQMEVCLAERAALLIWRLRRTAQAEIHWFDDRHKHGPEHKRGRSYMPGYDETNCVTRYEAHLGRELARTMKALKDLQSRPAGESESQISTLQSPISNASGVEQRTLNGSTPLRLDNVEADGGSTENYETNSARADECSETPSLHHSNTPAELNVSPSVEPAPDVEWKNCETNGAAPLHPTPHTRHPDHPVTAQGVAELAAIAMAPFDALLAEQRRQTESLERRLGIVPPDAR